jgi:hypothetical protein
MNVRRTFATLFTLALALTAIAAASGQAATRPDDRAGPLGVGAPAPTPSVIRPDDRAGPLGVGDDVVGRYVLNHPAAVRPDDRGGIRGVGAGTAGIVTPASAQGGSFWGATQIAGAASLGAIAVGLLGLALLRHRRSAVAALQG